MPDKMNTRTQIATELRDRIKSNQRVFLLMARYGNSNLFREMNKQFNKDCKALKIIGEVI
jgi:hypothetical protein